MEVDRVTEITIFSRSGRFNCHHDKQHRLNERNKTEESGLPCFLLLKEKGGGQGQLIMFAYCVKFEFPRQTDKF